MSVVRRFLVAPSLVRLLRKERGGSRITEGYFAPQGGRTSFVRIDGQQCQLVLVAGATGEERTDVPRAHGDALLDVCPGKAAYERTTVALGGGRDVLVDRYVTPAGLDLASVAFDDQGSADAFAAPAWFGPEVSADASYERHAIALSGVPQAAEVTLGNAALDAVLDLIEPRFGFGRFGGAPAGKSPEKPGERGPERAAEDDGVVNALRRMSGPTPVAVVPTPEPAAEPATAPVAEHAPVGATEAHNDAHHEPAHHEQTHHAGEPQAEAADTRIDDVIESLSQALGAAIHQPPAPAREEDSGAAFERWTVRPRRTQTQT